MKTLKKLKINFIVPVLIFISVMFMAGTCVDFNPDMIFRLVGVVPEKVYNCVDDTCVITIHLETSSPLDTLLIKLGANQGFEQIDFEVLEDGTYEVTITLERGVNTITLRGESFLDFSELSFTIECVCPQEGAPDILWDPDKPPTDTTAEDTVKLNIISNKELDALKVTTNGQQQVTQNPETEIDEDMYKYEMQVEMQEGVNEIEIQGENANGFSNLLQHNIEKGEPPVISFVEQPPSQVTNCVDEECKVTIYINCEQYLDEITYQVGEEDAIALTGLSVDGQGNYPIPVTLQKGVNVITFTAKNAFGTSNTLTCTIECVCEEPSSGYTKTDTIGEQEVPEPVGISLEPDYQAQKNSIVAITKDPGGGTKIKKGDLTNKTFQEKYPGKTFPEDVVGFTQNSNTMEEFLMLMDQIQKVNSQGNMSPLYTFGQGHTAQPGQLKFQNVDTSFITKNTTDVYFLNRNNTAEYSSNNKFVGLDIMRDAWKNSALYEKTALGTIVQTGSDGRATEQYIFTLAGSGQVTRLFDIPLSDGLLFDVITKSLDDDETVYFIVTTIKNETEYWVNIYSQAGEKLDAFKTHDLSSSDTRFISREEVFYKVLIDTNFHTDDNIYVMHSAFPGIQVWEPIE